MNLKYVYSAKTIPFLCAYLNSVLSFNVDFNTFLPHTCIINFNAKRNIAFFLNVFSKLITTIHKFSSPEFLVLAKLAANYNFQGFS